MGTEAYLIVASLLFLIGASGFLLRRNLLVMFMSIELMLNGAALLFVTFARHWNRMDGQIFVFFIIALAAAEAAVGLSILIAIFRLKHRVNADELSELKG
ncbi:MAG TPA: NADH-quinone oxidoreductase subunit NuoK [Planctomycetes bacterium]|nr:NADH-quinone oxidoreductase subunit NuoK [Planctomycetota bacterium]